MTDKEKIELALDALLDTRDSLVRIANVLGCSDLLQAQYGPVSKLNAVLAVLTG